MWPIAVILAIVLAVLSYLGMAGGFVTPLMIFAIVVVFFASGIKIVRPTERAVVERLGKYKGQTKEGFNWIIPIIDSIIRVNITEQMVDAEKQEIITADRLNATVDAQVYFKVKSDPESVRNSQYNVEDYETQIVALSKTTLRNIIGNMSYEKANSKREEINKKLTRILENEAAPWGIEIVRTEMKDIDPPKDVQSSMNEVVKAENTKDAAVDLAKAAETKADGEKRAAIKQAEGQKQSQILKADGEAQAIERVAEATATKYELENKALQKYFVGNAKSYKNLDVTQKALRNGTKYVIDSKSKITNVISDAAGVPIPIEKKQR